MANYIVRQDVGACLMINEPRPIVSVVASANFEVAHEVAALTIVDHVASGKKGLLSSSPDGTRNRTNDWKFSGMDSSG